MTLHPDTTVLHTAEGQQEGAAPLTRPIYATSTFVFASRRSSRPTSRASPTVHLPRYANPSVQAAEDKLAALEDAEAALVTSSGMAAISTALFGLLQAGDEVICSSAICGARCTSSLMFCGASASAPDSVAPGSAWLDRIVGPRTRVVWFESPINPTLRCVDIAQIAGACRARGVVSILDSTFASPVNQQPSGCVDLVMHSATKYLNGHSDVTAGALVGGREIIERLHPARKLFGGVLEPMSAYALARGMKTLGLRVARQNDSAMRVAVWCERHARVARVFYPGLASHPDHAIAGKQMSGFGGMVTIDVAGGYDAACRVFDRLRVIQRAASLGGVESLCSLPVLTSQFGFSDEQLAAAGVTRGMMRLSIGLEHPDDLIADLDQALG
jgi:cystathionine beta-lyase/cystathionine gamma-synthase